MLLETTCNKALWLLIAVVALGSAGIRLPRSGYGGRVVPLQGAQQEESGVATPPLVRLTPDHAA